MKVAMLLVSILFLATAVEALPGGGGRQLAWDPRAGKKCKKSKVDVCWKKCKKLEAEPMSIVQLVLPSPCTITFMDDCLEKKKDCAEMNKGKKKKKCCKKQCEESATKKSCIKSCINTSDDDDDGGDDDDADDDDECCTSAKSCTASCTAVCSTSVAPKKKQKCCTQLCKEACKISPNILCIECDDMCMDRPPNRA